MYVTGSSENTVSWECFAATDSRGGLPLWILTCLGIHSIVLPVLLSQVWVFCLGQMAWAPWSPSHFWIAVFPHLPPQIATSPQGLLTSIPSSTDTLVFNFPLNEMSANDKPCFTGAILWFNRAGCGLHGFSLVGALLFWHCFLLTCCTGNNGD